MTDARAIMWAVGIMLVAMENHVQSDLGIVFDPDPIVGSEGGETTVAEDRPVVGVRWTEIDGLPAVSSTATARWRVDRTDASLRLHEQRLAWVRANLEARAQLASFLEGATIDDLSRMRDAWAARGLDNGQAVESVTVEENRTARMITGVLRGVVLRDMTQDDERGLVTVTVTASPDSMDTWQARGGGVIEVESLDDARDRLRAEIRAGVVPPAGARLLIEPKTGRRQWLAFGSHFADPRSRPQGRAEAARTVADLRAQSALVGMLQGEEITERTLLDRRYAEMQDAVDDLLTGSTTESAEWSSDQVGEQVRESLVDGSLPPGVDSSRFTGDHGIWFHTILSFTPPSPRDESVGIHHQPVPGEEVTDPTPRTVEEDPDSGIRVLRTVGEGDSRRAAIGDALLEAVSMINGTLVHGHSIVAQRYQSAVQDFDRDLVEDPSTDLLAGETIESSSRGLVQRYDLIEEHRDESGRYRIEIRAWVPRFDPADPRPGERPTITVLPIQWNSPGGTSPSPADRNAGTLITAGINRVLLDSEAFMVLDDRYLGTLVGPAKATVDRMGTGRATTDELLVFSQSLPVDYVVMGSIEDLTSTKERVWIDLRKVYETRESLTIGVALRLIDVSRGTVEWMDSFQREWSTLDLARRPAQDRRLSSGRFACREALTDLTTSLRNYLETRMEP